MSKCGAPEARVYGLYHTPRAVSTMGGRELVAVVGAREVAYSGIPATFPSGDIGWLAEAGKRSWAGENILGHWWCGVRGVNQQRTADVVRGQGIGAWGKGTRVIGTGDAEAPAPRSSRVSTGTRATTNGGRNAMGNDWAITPRKTRRGRTTSKRSASGARSTSSRMPELRALVLARGQAAALGRRGTGGGRDCRVSGVGCRVSGFGCRVSAGNPGAYTHSQFSST